MSWGAVEWAKSWRGGLTSPEAFVLFIIAEHFNEKQLRSWPSTDTLCDLTRLGRSTVYRALGKLESDGLIAVEARFGTRGRPLQPRYCLPFYDPRSVPERERARRQSQPALDVDVETLAPAQRVAPALV